MSSRIRTPDPEDPLEAYSGLTLFPRTLASIPNAPKPFDADDPHRFHNFLKSMPLQSPDKLLEQAKSIIDSCSGLCNSTMSSFLNSKAQNETVAAKVIENPQERRPALGRKRARFSLKPNSSQPTVSLEPILDMDKLKDPEEFFLAFEKLENAKRELQKQTGGILMDLNQQNPSIASRPRRPGLLGRSVKYKHHYSNDMSSQETFKENIFGNSDLSVQQEMINSDAAFEQRESDDELQEMKADSVAKAENKVNELLDELLIGNCEELDGDGTVTLLQEHLRIKPIEIEKLCLPDLQDVRRFDLKASGANLPKPRSALSDIQNVLKGISSKTPMTHRQAESSVARLASPTPPKSPLDSIISLKKRILQSNSLNDPFSALNIDQLPARIASPFGSVKEHMAQGNIDNKSSSSPKLKSQMTEENDIAEMNISVPEVAIEDVGSPNKTMEDNLSRPSSGIYVGSGGSNAYVDDNIGGNCTGSRVVIGISGSPATNTDAQRNNCNELDDKMEDTPKEAADSVHPGPNTEDSNALNELDDKMGDMLKEAVEAQQSGLNMENSTVENLKTKSQLDASNLTVVEEHVVDAPSIPADTGSELHNEEAQISTKEPLNEQSKAVSTHKKRKRREVSRRESLAAFGSSWNGETRRSTRITSRPLEYWRGERFLYGRVIDSLATVIGIKYESPDGKNGKPTLKVKSYVPDKFKDLVEGAARF